MRRHILCCLLCALCVSCARCGEDPSPSPSQENADVGRDVVQDTDERDVEAVDTPLEDDVADADIVETFAPSPGEVLVEVRLDGVATSDVRVVQGGAHGQEWWTDTRGRVRIRPNPEIEGELILLASHPQARIKGVKIDREELASGVAGETLQVISITRYEIGNPDYAFQNPGEPGDRKNTTKCGHCHQTINDAWYASPHRTSASNTHVYDLYTGSASNVRTEQECCLRGGVWGVGSTPGTGESEERCYLGDHALRDLNASCGEDPAQGCEEEATRFGYCASCHAPALRKTRGSQPPMGYNLLDAREIAYEYGVSCDVCHRVESVDLTSHLPGISGRLVLGFPREPASPSIGPYLPLTFGPSHDVPNPRMGSVQRDHYRNGQICSGCHQHEQPALMAGQSVDLERWPSGKLPIQTTWAEWEQGPMRDIAPCVSCHMPPDPSVSNAGDLQLYPLATVGVQGGWHRPPGSVRKHSWVGPRQPASRMLELALSVDVQSAVQPGGEDVEIRVTTRNVGPGHFVPTGEPSRAVFVRVEAQCGDRLLDATGGAIIPAWGGWLDRKERGEDWGVWQGAEVGDRIRVVSLGSTFYNYDGFGPFSAEGRFEAAQKGMTEDVFRGVAEVLAVTSQGRVTLDRALPQGDVAFRVREAPLRDGQSQPLAGAPGFAFARVTADMQGTLMVPHHRATDIVSDNRLGVGKAWTSRHLFSGVGECTEPIRARAVVLYRPHAWETATTKAWEMNDRVMTSSERIFALPEGGE